MLNRAGLLRVEKTLSFIYNGEGQHTFRYLQIDFFLFLCLSLHICGAPHPPGRRLSGCQVYGENRLSCEFWLCLMFCEYTRMCEELCSTSPSNPTAPLVLSQLIPESFQKVKATPQTNVQFAYQLAHFDSASNVLLSTFTS